MSDQILKTLIENMNRLKERVSHLERLEAIMGSYGWDGAAWRKDPIRLGYSGDKSQLVTANAAAGSNTVSGDVVPAGEIWIVQAISATETTNAPTSIFLSARVNTVDQYLQVSYTPAVGQWLTWTGEIVLSEGDNIRAIFAGSTAGDGLVLRFHAVKVAINQ